MNCLTKVIKRIVFLIVLFLLIGGAFKYLSFYNVGSETAYAANGNPTDSQDGDGDGDGDEEDEGDGDVDGDGGDCDP